MERESERRRGIGEVTRRRARRGESARGLAACVRWAAEIRTGAGGFPQKRTPHLPQIFYSECAYLGVGPRQGPNDRSL